MENLGNYEFWFITGSQDLYGEETLKQVAKDSKEIVEKLNASKALPCNLVWKPTLLTPDAIRETLQQANADDKCAGIICWMHTFSPAKMWIAGLSAYKKPLLQLNTQFNEEIPYATMDMDFMNLNQSAHGDREFGFITSRMELPRKVIVGHWSHARTQKRIADWMRIARAVADGKTLRCLRFGDNMREVAVTDGDKVEAMIKFGWSVPYYGIGDLVAYMNEVKDSDVNALFDEYNQKYEIVYGSDKDFVTKQIKEQAKIEIALRRFLKDNNGKALCTNFQDLHGMKQLPGLAIQRLLADGYGFGAEGDWKTSCLVRTFKAMTAGQVVPGSKGNAFMEDYTYNLVEGEELNMGSHMLEVDPEIAVSKPKIEVHPLGIGDKEDPARMVWQPLPSLETSAEAWILAGGGHHTAFSNIITQEMIQDWAEMVGIECVVIDEGTKIPAFRNELRWNRAFWDNRK